MSNTDSNSKRESNSGLDCNIFKYFTIKTLTNFDIIIIQLWIEVNNLISLADCICFFNYGVLNNL